MVSVFDVKEDSLQAWTDRFPALAVALSKQASTQADIANKETFSMTQPTC